MKLLQESITRSVHLWYWVNVEAVSFKRLSYLRLVSCHFFSQAKRWEGVHCRNRSAEEEQKRVCLLAKLPLLSLVHTCDLRDAIVIAVVRESRQNFESIQSKQNASGWSSRVHWNWRCYQHVEEPGSSKYFVFSWPYADICSHAVIG